MDDNKKATLGLLAELFGRLAIAERNFDAQTEGFEDGAVGNSIAQDIREFAERHSAQIGKPMATFSSDLAALALMSRGTRDRPAIHLRIEDHITTLSRIVIEA